MRYTQILRQDFNSDLSDMCLFLECKELKIHSHCSILILTSTHIPDIHFFQLNLCKHITINTFDKEKTERFIIQDKILK